MTAKTNAQKQQAARNKRAAADLFEVRGIFAPRWLHEMIKAAAAKLQRKAK